MSAPLGFFIVLEGIDGSGTTSQGELLFDALTERGLLVVLTREPSRGPVGKFLREVLTGQVLGENQDPLALDWASMAALFAADRLDHLNREVLPALAKGAVVISDRYDLSSLIYQSGTCPEGDSVLPWLRQLNSRARRPDLTLVLDVAAEVAERRRAARGGLSELYEKASLQRRLAGLYQRASSLLPGDEIRLLDGNGPMTEVAQRIWSLVSAHPEFGKIAQAG